MKNLIIITYFIMSITLAVISTNNKQVDDTKKASLFIGNTHIINEDILIEK